MLTIYHNARCGKSRSACRILQESGKPFKTVEYLKDVPSVEEIKDILNKLGIKPHDLIRTKEAIYQQKYKGKTLTDDEWILAMNENPVLIERPIVLNGDKAVIARPPELAMKLI